MLLDLHCHSTFSDGTKNPAEIVKIAKEKNLEYLSLTDHDNTRGIKIAHEEAKKSGINFVTGVEISCEYPTMLDMLGYGMNIYDEKFHDTLEKLLKYREDRNILMIDKFKTLDIDINIEEVQKEAGSKVIGRPHFARVLVKKGYVNNKDEAFDKYLGDGKKAYMPKKRLTPEEAIDLIKNAGGYPVLAHPKYINLKSKDFIKLVKKLKNIGLSGIEVFYSKHSKGEIEFFKKVAIENDLLMTSGSDFHGENKPDISLGMSVEDKYLEKTINTLFKS